MKLWSINPTFLDRHALSGVWRNALKAQKVLYPEQGGLYVDGAVIEDGGDASGMLLTGTDLADREIDRFRSHGNPIGALGVYLWEVAWDASERGYSFNFARIEDPPPLMAPKGSDPHIRVTQKRMKEEFDDLISRLEKRELRHAERLKTWLATMKEKGVDGRIIGHSKIFHVEGCPQCSSGGAMTELKDAYEVTYEGKKRLAISSANAKALEEQHMSFKPVDGRLVKAEKVEGRWRDIPEVLDVPLLEPIAMSPFDFYYRVGGASGIVPYEETIPWPGSSTS